MTTLTERLDDFEGRLQTMEAELRALRRLARDGMAAPAETEPLWQLLEAEAGARPEPAPAALPSPPRPHPPAAPAPRRRREPLDLSAILDARLLAWTGGAVTLLGIVFFFVLAVERGWIGPGMRVALGAGASTVLVGGALWLRRRFGETYTSVSAAGAGIAGFYATLLAATSLYDLVPASAALATATAIGALGASLAWRWRSETLAALGLLGAILVPVPIAVQGDLTPLGVLFAALVLAAATVVADLRGWRVLHVAAVGCAAPQALALSAYGPANAAYAVFGMWLVLAAVPAWLALRTRLTYYAAWLLMFSAFFGGWCAGLLFEGNARGAALLVLAAMYALTATAYGTRDRDTSSLLWAIGLTLAAVGAASLFAGATLTIVWSAEAAALAWVARRLREPRFQLAALLWLGLAFLHGLSSDAPLTRLFIENDEPWRSVPSATALSLAAAAVALYVFEWNDRPEGIFTRMIADLRAAQASLRTGGFTLAGMDALYAGSLAVVGIPADWDWGQVLVAALWSALAASLVWTRLRVWAMVALAACLVLVVFYDLQDLAETQRSWCFAVVASAAFVIAVVYELRSTRPAPVSFAALVASVALATASLSGLLDGDAAWAFLALACIYAGTGVAVLRSRRDLASALGLAALVLALPASVWLLEGTWLVLAWTTAAGMLAALARYEERLELGSLAYLGLALAHTLVFEARPVDVVIARGHPGAGIPALLLAIAALAIFIRQRSLARSRLLWACGALALYAATLAILEASEDLGGTVSNAFQRGHTAVSAVWAIVGLVLLILGLRRSRALQIGGFALFGISLAKLFLYDLAFLSSITRAFSFVAVGMLLLVGGFFYQRMALDSRT